MNGRVEISVEPKDVKLFVILVLVGLPSRNLDYRIDFIGRGIPGRQSEIIRGAFGFDFESGNTTSFRVWVGRSFPSPFQAQPDS